MTRAQLRLAAVVAASLVGTIVIAVLGGTARLTGAWQTLAHHAWLFAAVFALWALVANCLVLPAGSMSLIAGGAVLGMTIPAGIWFAAQLFTAPLLYRTVRNNAPEIQAMIDRHVPRAVAHVAEKASQDGIWASVVLRLTPVIPNAPACMIAAAAGIDLRAFMIGSVLAGWVRPLYFASLGATLGSLAQISELTAVDVRTLLPLLGLCAATALLFGVRLYVSDRRGPG